MLGVQATGTAIATDGVLAIEQVASMLVVLADCLTEPVQKALTEEVMREQLRMYSES